MILSLLELLREFNAVAPRCISRSRPSHPPFCTLAMETWRPQLRQRRLLLAAAALCASYAVALPGCGENCLLSYQGRGSCAEDLICRADPPGGFKGMCEDPIEEGGACKNSASSRYAGCAVGLYCVDGACVKAKPLGEAQLYCTVAKEFLRTTQLLFFSCCFLRYAQQLLPKLRSCMYCIVEGNEFWIGGSWRCFTIPSPLSQRPRGRRPRHSTHRALACTRR